MTLFTLPRGGGSPAARRMEAAGMAFERRERAARMAAARRPAPPPAPVPASPPPTAAEPDWPPLGPPVIWPHERREPRPEPILRLPWVTVADIQMAVCVDFEVDRADILSSRRARSIVRPRQVAMYLAKMLTPRSLPEIGRRFGGRDHTTVLHAVRKVQELSAADPVFAARVDAIRRSLTPASEAP